VRTNAPNLISAGAPLQTPLGELTVLLQTLRWILGFLLLREERGGKEGNTREGVKGEQKGGKRRKGEMDGRRRETSPSIEISGYATGVGWQVTLCDLIRQVTLRCSVMGFSQRGPLRPLTFYVGHDKICFTVCLWTLKNCVRGCSTDGCFHRQREACGSGDATTGTIYNSPSSARNRVFTRSSKRPANVQQLARVFWIHLLEVCWTFAWSCKHPIIFKLYNEYARTFRIELRYRYDTYVRQGLTVATYNKKPSCR